MLIILWKLHFISNNKSVVEKSINILNELINNASLIKIKINQLCVNYLQLRNENKCQKTLSKILVIIN